MSGELNAGLGCGLERQRQAGARRAWTLAVLAGAVLGGVVALGIPGAARARGAGAPSTRFLIVPAVSIGPVKLGESKASVVAIAGAEHPVVSEHNLVHDYPDLHLYVVYLAGRVAEISVSSVEADSLPGYANYHTVNPDVGVGDSYTRWRRAYPRVSCKTTILHNEPGTPDTDYVECLVTAATGNFTTYTFAAPEPNTPELLGIGVYVRSLRAAAQASGIP